MTRTMSRALSVVLVAFTAWRSWSILKDEWYVVLAAVPLLVLIWFPEWVDELSFGATRGGYQIDSHTPAFLISAVGWVLLLLGVSSIVAPTAWCRLFGAC